MIFKIKQSKLTLDCFTYMRSVHELYKVRKAVSYFPEDIKSLARYTSIVNPQTNIAQDISTIKGCNGLTELYKLGFIIPFWTDAIFQPKSFSVGNTALGSMPKDFGFDTHPPAQYPNIYDGWVHAKLISPWVFREKTGVKFSWNGASWNLHKHAKNLTIAPGALWFNDQATAHVNVFINKDIERFELTAGTPLVHMIPITDKDVDIKCHLVSYDEWLSVQPIPQEYNGMAINRWGRYWKELAKAKELDKKEAKCPFGFGKK